MVTDLLIGGGLCLSMLMLCNGSCWTSARAIARLVIDWVRTR